MRRALFCVHLALVIYLGREPAWLRWVLNRAFRAAEHRER